MGNSSDSDDEHSRVTIYDVAKMAKVAPSTVSRTFSRPGRVNSETAAKVRKVAEDLGYRSTAVAYPPNTATGLIGVAVPDVAKGTFAEIVSGIRREAAAAGYAIVLVDSRESDILERSTLESAVGMVEGMILISPRLSETAILQIAKHRPLVTINREVHSVPAVVTDISKGMEECVNYLHDLGHTSLTFLPGPAQAWEDGLRWQALLESTQRHGMSIRRTPSRRPTVAGGAAASRSWLLRKTTAVLAHNDMMAIGFMISTQSLGLEVPRDVSVVGTDNIFTSTLVSPPLTTLTSSRRTQGAMAFKRLLEQIRHQHRDPTTPTDSVPMRLVTRESTGVAPS